MHQYIKTILTFFWSSRLACIVKAINQFSFLGCGRAWNGLTLTLAILHGWFKTCRAGAGSYRNHPLSVSIAIKLQWHWHLQGVRNTSSWSNDQGRRLGSGCCLRENGKVCDGGGALLVINPHWNEWNAGPKVLKGQVEPGFGQWPKTSHFCVHASSVELGEALVWSNSVHLHVWVLHPERAGGGGRVRVGLIVKEVKSLFAGSWDVWDAVAISHCEFHFNVNTQHILSRYKITA